MKITKADAMFFRNMCVSSYEVGVDEVGNLAERPYHPVIMNFLNSHGVYSNDTNKCSDFFRQVANHLSVPPEENNK